MSAVAVAIACLWAWFVWMDAFPLLGRLVALRERRLDADLAREARHDAERERATRSLRAADLPDDLEVLARQWGEHAESVRSRARELFAEVREDAGTDDEAWARVRVTLIAEAHETGDGVGEL
jgi:hypothetical protein